MHYYKGTPSEFPYIFSMENISPKMGGHLMTILVSR